MADSEIDPTAHTVDELTDEIESLDDPEALTDLYETETDTQNRKGVKQAIERRLDEIDTEDTDDSIADTREAIERSLDEIDDNGDEPSLSIVDIQRHVRDHAPELINSALDSIVEVERNEDGGRAIAEFIERRSVPDTQDIIGQYEILIDSSGQIHSYRRLNRYRRGDTKDFE